MFKSALKQAAAAILQRQRADGAILMAPADQPVNSLIPYFANLAAIGLAAAYPRTRDASHRVAVAKWLRWYAAHQNPNGTISDYRLQDGNLQPTGDCDSTDSYAATFLEALHRYVEVSRDRQLLDALYTAAVKATGAIRLTLQDDGLTWAKPTYRVKYLMDNVEVYRGWQSAAALALLMNRKGEADTFQRLAGRVLRAIDTILFHEEKGYYAFAMNENGTMEARLERWYPDVMAQLMAVAWLPPAPRRKELFGRLRQQFQTQWQDALEGGEVSVLVWWGMAALGAGDRPFAERIARKLAEEQVLNQPQPGPAEYGHILRICSNWS